ncbi:PD-(D/E)XK nuclease family protein [Terribacillus saccharophilus]|uniref:PDDEXK-like family protein n=1 Tax=Terribacillus saccharophilus TaxID=361277 RepID=UPI0039819A85
MEIVDILELENDQSFQLLNQQVNSFNSLKILKLRNHEIRHSNILSWLLNPRENHGLSDYFLKKIVEHLILMDENDATLNGHVSEILNYSLVDSHVYREVKTDKNRYIDLLVVNRQMNFVFLIENKFYSSESANQLDDYLEYIQGVFEGFTIIPVYLTLHGEEPSNEKYLMLTYERIERIISGILMLFKEQLNVNVYRFIEEYNQLLKEKFYSDEEQMLQAIEVYRNHKDTVDKLFEETSLIHKQLNFESGYQYEFVAKYKDTIKYIYNQGQNLLAYSFEQFITANFEQNILYNAHPRTPNLIPPEWSTTNELYRRKNYWLGQGFIVWFEQAGDDRLRMVAELGRIEYNTRLSFLRALEEAGVSIRKSAKLEKARYTRFYVEKIDVNKWNDVEELKQAMIDLYESPKFKQLRENVAQIITGEAIKERPIAVDEQPVISTTNSLVKDTFKKWMKSLDMSESNYRVSPKHLSFKIPLFDSYKEQLGETREKWWWYDGPFLFWMKYSAESIFFTLEVGPIEAEQRVKLMEILKAKGIKFSKKGLQLEAKFNRIHTERVTTKGLDEGNLLNLFNSFYNNKRLSEILEILGETYDELFEKVH